MGSLQILSQICHHWMVERWQLWIIGWIRDFGIHRSWVIAPPQVSAQSLGQASIQRFTGHE
jgi:hypothetical protein